jgi:hypothetical protein
MTVKENLLKLKQDLQNTPIKIIAVTKYTTVVKIIEAYEAGLRIFGESKIQDVEKKFSELPEEIKTSAEWHLIGHLQTNKVKKAIGKFNLIHSVDSLKLAERISSEAEKQNILQDILLQVNITGEESKHGFKKEDIQEKFQEILELSHLNIKGFMTMAPLTNNEHIIRECFRGLKELKDKIHQQYNKNLPELSMGMSNDYKIAIEEGSTMIRIGQKLFS